MKQAVNEQSEKQTVFQPLFTEILDIIASQKFIDERSPVSDDEPIIGQMTDYERALSTFLEQCGDREVELVEANSQDGMLIGSAEEQSTFKREVTAIRYRYKAGKELLWGSIRERLHETIEAAEDQTGIGIRQGGQVVLLFGDDPCAWLGGLLGGQGAGIRITSDELGALLALGACGGMMRDRDSED